MTGSSGGTLPTCPNGHPAAFEGQRFCEVCRMPIGEPAGAATPEPANPPIVSPVAPPPAAEPPAVTSLPGAPVVAGPTGRGGGRSQLPLLLGLVVCLAVVAGAVFVVAKPFGASSASPSGSAAAVVGSPSSAPTDTPAGMPTDTPAGTATAAPTPASTPVSTPAPAGPARWVSAGALHAARGSTRLLALTDGRALVVGDDNFCEPGPAYDSSMATEIWEADKWAVTGSLNSARDDLTAQPIANGQALVVGGTNVDGISFSSTKVWDPKTGAWTDAGLLATARSYPASALLKDGRVVVIGGEYLNYPTDTFLATAEVFSPATGKWTKTGSLKVARSGAMAVTLADGRVLVAGGYTAKNTVADSEIWDPSSGAWTAIGATPIWGGSVLVPLADGGALLAGGRDSNFKGIATASRLDPKAGKWVATGKMLTAAFDRAAAVLANGKVLVAGGLAGNFKSAIAVAELFDPATGTWAATLPMPSAREQSKAVALPDGSILFAGGDAGYFGPVSTPWCPREITDTLRYIPAVP